MSYNIENVVELFKKLSSGESILVFNLLALLVNIRYDSLILFDEPETHLHPNSITSFMYLIYKRLDKFQSFAIISTHSPLIVREIKSDSVYIMERDNDFCSIRGIGYESLGANLTTVTEDIFKNKEIQPHFLETIKKMKKEGISKNEIIKLIKSENQSLGLGLSLYIEGLFNKDEEN